MILLVQKTRVKKLTKAYLGKLFSPEQRYTLTSDHRGIDSSDLRPRRGEEQDPETAHSSEAIFTGTPQEWKGEYSYGNCDDPSIDPILYHTEDVKRKLPLQHKKRKREFEDDNEEQEESSAFSDAAKKTVQMWSKANTFDDSDDFYDRAGDQ